MGLSSFSNKLLSAYAEQPFLLAPMAGVTDPAYRIICRRCGAEIAHSEMVSVAGLNYASNKTWRLVLPAEEEPSISVQLFGSKPAQFRSAVWAVQERVGEKLFSIDINMACPARKVISKGEGSALMDDPFTAEKIVLSAVEEAHVPVTVKIRKGFGRTDNNAVEFAQMLEGAGASGIAVHGRTGKQLYTGSADWGIIDAVARAVSVPVVGSGDVFSAEDAVRMLRTTAASAVFIARGTYGNPWIFNDAKTLLNGGAQPVHSTSDRLGTLRDHLALTHELLPLMSRARTYGTHYIKGLPHAAHWRNELVHCTAYEEFCETVDAIEADLALVSNSFDADSGPLR